MSRQRDQVFAFVGGGRTARQVTHTVVIGSRTSASRVDDVEHHACGHCARLPLAV